MSGGASRSSGSRLGVAALALVIALAVAAGARGGSIEPGLEAGNEQGAAQVQAALDALDPALLEPPPSELPDAARRGRGGRRDQGAR